MWPLFSVGVASILYYNFGYDGREGASSVDYTDHDFTLTAVQLGLSALVSALALQRSLLMVRLVVSHDPCLLLLVCKGGQSLQGLCGPSFSCCPVRFCAAEDDDGDSDREAAHHHHHHQRNGYAPPCQTNPADGGGASYRFDGEEEDGEARGDGSGSRRRPALRGLLGGFRKRTLDSSSSKPRSSTFGSTHTSVDLGGSGHHHRGGPLSMVSSASSSQRSSYHTANCSHTTTTAAAATASSRELLHGWDLQYTVPVPSTLKVAIVGWEYPYMDSLTMSGDPLACSSATPKPTLNDLLACSGATTLHHSTSGYRAESDAELSVKESVSMCTMLSDIIYEVEVVEGLIGLGNQYSSSLSSQNLCKSSGHDTSLLHMSGRSGRSAGSEATTATTSR